MTMTLKPCPFCGNTKPTFERLGTPRQSCIVACGYCGCRNESADEGDDCGKTWNERAIEAELSKQEPVAQSVMAKTFGEGWAGQPPSSAPDTVQVPRAELEELRDKAWKYDDLCK